MVNKSPDRTTLLNETAPRRITELSVKLEVLRLEMKRNPENISKLEELHKTRDELLQLRREVNRTKRYTEISWKELSNWAVDLDNIPASNLMRIDRDNKTERRWEFFSRSYLYKRTIDESGNIYEEPSDGKSLKEGDTLFIDLWKNTGKKSAYWTIWLWDMLSIDIWYIKINGAIWIRSIVNGRVWYYTKPSPDGYIAVFTGNTITIPSASEISEFTKIKAPKLERNTSQEESDKAFDMRIERIERHPESSNIEYSTNMRESYDFWKSKWLSEEQIAGFLANEYQESKCNPWAESDKENGVFKAKGIFQWHPARRDAILKATGINIEIASHWDQLKAAWWEITEDSFEKKVFPLLKNASTASEAAGIISKIYLRPKNEVWEMNERWKIAQNIFNQFRFINNPELANLAEWEANKKIVEFALDAQKRGDILWAEHCTDWVDKIYRETTWNTVYRNSLYNGVSQSKIWLWTWLHGTHADTNQIAIIQPGNHIMVDHMENWKFSRGRTHSVIALSRPINGIVEVVSYPNNRILPRVEKYDLMWEWRAKNGKVLRIQAA